MANRMRRIARPLVGLGVVGALVLSLATVAVARVSTSHAPKVTAPPAFTDEQLNAPAGDDWIVQAGNLQGQRHSTLTDITPANVAGMKQAFHVKLNAPNVGDPLLQ